MAEKLQPIFSCLFSPYVSPTLVRRSLEELTFYFRAGFTSCKMFLGWLWNCRLGRMEFLCRLLYFLFCSERWVPTHYVPFSTPHKLSHNDLNRVRGRHNPWRFTRSIRTLINAFTELDVRALVQSCMEHRMSLAFSQFYKKLVSELILEKVRNFFRKKWPHYSFGTNCTPHYDCHNVYRRFANTVRTFCGPLLLLWLSKNPLNVYCASPK
jgi:hypothetical protein